MIDNNDRLKNGSNRAPSRADKRARVRSTGMQYAMKWVWVLVVGR